MDSQSSESTEQQDDLAPATPIHYRVVAWVRREITTGVKWFVGLFLFSLAGLVAWLVSLVAVSVVLVPQFTSGREMAPGELLFTSWQYMPPFLDSMSSLESQFAVFVGLSMFFCGAGAWYIYTKLTVIVPRVWQQIRGTPS